MAVLCRFNPLWCILLSPAGSIAALVHFVIASTAPTLIHSIIASKAIICSTSSGPHVMQS